MAPSRHNQTLSSRHSANMKIDNFADFESQFPTTNASVSNRNEYQSKNFSQDATPNISNTKSRKSKIKFDLDKGGGAFDSVAAADYRWAKMNALTRLNPTSLPQSLSNQTGVKPPMNSSLVRSSGSNLSFSSRNLNNSTPS